MVVDGSQAETLVRVVEALARLANSDTYGRCQRDNRIRIKGLGTEQLKIDNMRTVSRTVEDTCLWAKGLGCLQHVHTRVMPSVPAPTASRIPSNVNAASVALSAAWRGMAGLKYDWAPLHVLSPQSAAVLSSTPLQHGTLYVSVSWPAVSASAHAPRCSHSTALLAVSVITQLTWPPCANVNNPLSYGSIGNTCLKGPRVPPTLWGNVAPKKKGWPLQGNELKGRDEGAHFGGRSCPIFPRRTL